MNNLRQETCFLLGQICKLYQTHANALLNTIDLHRGQELILGQLWAQEGLTHSELAERLNVQPATLSNALNSMERKGFISRHRDDDDHRVWRVYLTEAGQALQPSVAEIWTELEQSAFTAVTVEEQQELNRLLTKIHRSLNHFAQ